MFVFIADGAAWDFMQRESVSSVPEEPGGYSPQGGKELYTTEQLHFTSDPVFSLS